MSNKVVVIDYGIGNVFSVCNALKQIDADVKLTRDKDEILSADRVILPGVGAFAKAMEALEDLHLVELLNQYKQLERPFLGICIGMQVLMDNSEEFGSHHGLGFIKGTVVRIDKDTQENLRVPHISWANIRPQIGQDENAWSDTPLASFKRDRESVYFVHSYHCKPANLDTVLAQADYEGVELTAAIQEGSIYGVQFHPERSGGVGQKFLQGFMKL